MKNYALNSFRRGTKRAYRTAKGYRYELKNKQYSRDNSKSENHKHVKGDSLTEQDAAYRSGFLNGFNKVNRRAQNSIKRAFYQGRKQGFRSAMRTRRTRRF